MEENDKKVIIDYLSVTFPLKPQDNQTEQDRVYEIMRMFRNFLNLHPCQVQECDYGVNRFKYQFILSDFIYLRCLGPENEDGFHTCQLELKGEGCREFERLREDITWWDFLYYLVCLDSRFKRIDVTIDDFSGMEMSMEYLYNKVKKGHYCSVFRTNPKFYGTIDTGLTIDFGTKTSMIELCVYDKRLQQIYLGKEVDEVYWCRYEMRFRQDKAHNVVCDLLQNYKDSKEEVYGIALGKFARAQLYAVLDIKKDNNYSRKDQKKAATDKCWNDLLDNAEKGILPKADPRESNTDGSVRYIVPKFKMIWLLWYIKCNRNLELLNLKLNQEMQRQLMWVTNSQLKRFNQFLKEDGKDPLTKDEFRDIITEISFGGKEMMLV